MAILVTGGLGYIGSHTCVKLIEAGYSTIIIDNLDNSKKSVLSRIEQISGKRPVFYYGDIRDKGFLDNIFSENNIEGVIHFAGLKAVGESVTMPLAYYNANVYGSICLAEVMQKHQVYNLIFSSSATVYGEKIWHLILKPTKREILQVLMVGVNLWRKIVISIYKNQLRICGVSVCYAILILSVRTQQV